MTADATGLTLEHMLAPPSKRVIHKFSALAGEIELGMPAKFLNVAVQGNTPYFWVEHSPDSSVKITAEIVSHGTGDEVKEGFQYLGTYLEDEGKYVWHVYAKARQK